MKAMLRIEASGPRPELYSLRQLTILLALSKTLLEVADMPTKYDLAIRWNDERSSLRAIEQTGAVPIYGRPKFLRCPGGVVAIVGNNNQILLLFKTAAIVGTTRVTLADGKSIPNGCVIRADRKTMRRPTKPSKVPIRGWYRLGAFRYFDFAKMRAVVTGELEGSREYVDGEKSGAKDFIFHPLAKGIPGLSHHEFARLNWPTSLI
jgi:hypothetical protein